MDEKKISNQLKVLALEMINNAGSGHSGSVLSCGDAIYTLYTRHILTDGTKNMNRDRFVLSNGHVCAILYSVLAGLNYIDIKDLKDFRKYNSLLAGHPEADNEFIDCSTGPLGQGVANAVGMSIAETIMNERFGVDHFTYCLCGDGCLQEGVALEALSVAGLYGLNKFILLYDKNDVTLDGGLEKSSSDDVVKKFESMNFNVIVCDGHDIEKIDKAIIKAKQSENKPTVIILNTKIGKDTFLEGSNKSHGFVYPLEEIQKLKKLYGITNDYLTLNDETKQILNDKKNKIISKFNEKLVKFNEKLRKNTKLLKKFNNFINNQFDYKVEFNKTKMSTREANNLVLNDIAKTNENIVVLSADLSSSTKVEIKNAGNYTKENRLGRNISLGIREHAMGAIANGIALHGGIVPITATFLAFSNYMIPAIRMAGIMNLPVVFTFSHSSAYEIGDGVTHVPVEQLDQLRLIPNVFSFEVSDSADCKAAYDWFFDNKRAICLCVSKTACTQLLSQEDKSCGAYFVTNGRASINIMTSGIDVETALEIKKQLKEEKVDANVINMISLEVFDSQPNKIKAKFLNKPLFVVESSTCVKYLKYTPQDHIFNTAKFGVSGDSVNLRCYYGNGSKTITKKILKILHKK